MTSAHPTGAAPPGGFPLWPLIATMGVQTLATMAAYTVPVLAPVIARDLGVDGALSGYFVSVVYGAGIVSSLFAAGVIHRLGAVRVGQIVLLATLAMQCSAAVGAGVAMLALSALLLGSAYGAPAPASTHLLVPRTPHAVMNLVLSVRQIGVPLGGMLAALLVPPLALRVGWQTALLIEAIPVVLLLVLLEGPRRRWDAGASGAPLRAHSGPRQVLGMLRGHPELQRLSLACVVYSGLQLCFVAFTTVHLTTRAGFDVVAAGQALAVFQVSGVLTRPVWGWIADNRVPARVLLSAQGLVMCVAAVLAGQFGAGWPLAAVLAVCALAGSTASGYTGIAYAEYARLGGERRTEATGLGSAAMFTGVLLLPSLAALLVTSTGSYGVAYGVMGAAAAAAGLLMTAGPRPRAH
ncbi:MAG: MFS transporter [Burkholderiales bacterium]|nr:MFS transporter [Burkholderiales bacterium]